MSPNITVIMVISMFPAKSGVIHSKKISERHVKGISLLTKKRMLLKHSTDNIS